MSRTVIVLSAVLIAVAVWALAGSGFAGLAALVAAAGVVGSLFFARFVAARATERGAAARSATVGAPSAADPLASSTQAQISALIELFGEGILLLDGEGTVVAANQAAARILGRPREGMTGVSLIRAARDHAFVDVLREAAGEPREVVLGDQRVIFATAAPAQSGPIRTVLTLQDLTALRRAERARQELVANVSHELRTPIAAALALAETLESGVEEEDHRTRFHHQLTTEIERLGRMVDRLLRLSRLESRAEEFVVEPLAVADLLHEARRRIEPVAERKSVTVRCEMTPDGLQVLADRERILEVLSNLADNAVRHSPDGEVVTLSAQREADQALFSVHDRGPGILPQDRPRVFERFYTGDRARSEGRGTGLGLAIARHIVSRHGGEIWVGENSRGATLYFTLPAAAAAS